MQGIAQTAPRQLWLHEYMTIAGANTAIGIGLLLPLLGQRGLNRNPFHPRRLCYCAFGSVSVPAGRKCAVKPILSAHSSIVFETGEVPLEPPWPALDPMRIRIGPEPDGQKAARRGQGEPAVGNMEARSRSPEFKHDHEERRAESFRVTAIAASTGSRRFPPTLYLLSRLHRSARPCSCPGVR